MSIRECKWIRLCVLTATRSRMDNSFIIVIYCLENKTHYEIEIVLISMNSFIDLNSIFFLFIIFYEVF